MKLIESISEMQDLSRQWRCQGQTVGFVPTMGALHQGHLSLIRVAKRESQKVVVSIFVNPTQFGPGEDYNSYPRRLEQDLQLCQQEGVDAVFAPKTEEMYPEGFATKVEVSRLTEHLCGAFRPGHFAGVATVVVKLFNAVLPDTAVFGMKDAQQFFVIKRMVQDLNMPIRIVPGPTIREKDGLAMSSRNAYLTPEQRKQAPVLYRALLLAEELVFSRGLRDVEKLTQQMTAFISQEAPDMKVQYIQAVDTENLQPLSTLKGEVLLAAAVFLGKARLIDNIVLKIDK